MNMVFDLISEVCLDSEQTSIFSSMPEIYQMLCFASQRVLLRTNYFTDAPTGLDDLLVKNNNVADEETGGMTHNNAIIPTVRSNNGQKAVVYWGPSSRNSCPVI